MRLNAKMAPTRGPVHEPAATQVLGSAAELDRLVQCCMLGERQFYVDGVEIAARIAALVPILPAQTVRDAAVSARLDSGLRHVPLLLLALLAARKEGPMVRGAARAILRTPRDAMDLVALYWANGKRPLPHAFKAAIRDGFSRWTAHQIAKYSTLTNVSVRLRDLAFLARPKPGDGRAELFKALADDKLGAPDTWEAQLSVPGVDKRRIWERLLFERKLGALALVRNLRNMEGVGVDPELVRHALAEAKAGDVWPWQALAAAREAPGYTHDLDALMVRSAGVLPRIPGRTGILVDVSGSMDDQLSERGTMKRLDAAAGLAVVLREVCETKRIAVFSDVVAPLDPPYARGATLARQVVDRLPHRGTRLGAAVAEMLQANPSLDRLIVLTDEQSQDRVEYGAVETYVVNLASCQRGVNWQGRVVRINGWSGGVVRFLAQQIAGSAPPVEHDQEGEGE